MSNINKLIEQIFEEDTPWHKAMDGVSGAWALVRRGVKAIANNDSSPLPKDARLHQNWADNYEKQVSSGQRQPAWNDPRSKYYNKKS